MIRRGLSILRAILALAALASLSGVAHAQTVTADWNNLGISSLAGVPSPSSMSASDGTNVQVTHSSVTNGGTFQPTYGGSFVSFYSGQIGSANAPLLMNFDNSAYDPGDKVTVIITLGRNVTGLQFRLTDIDNGGFQDAVEVAYDNGSGSFQNAATNTAFWSANSGVSRTNNLTVNGWIGVQNSDQTATTGDLSFNFGTTQVKRIRITYFSNTGFGDPGAQYAGISALTFNAAGADLSLSKALLTSNPTSGGSATYRLTVTNAASSALTATGVTVRDILPAGFTYVSSSGTGTYNPGTGIWTAGSIAPGVSVSIDLTGTVNASAGASFVNTAEITASSAPDPDSTPNNGATNEDDYASATLTVSGVRVAGTPPNLSCPAGSVLFDWSTRTWTAGSTSNSYQFDAIGQIQFQLQNPGTWVNLAATGGQSPNLQTVVHGGTNDVSLLELVDMPNRSAVATTTITLPEIMRGAQFRIIDVDFNSGQFADLVRIEGRYQGATVMPTVTNGVSNYVIGNTAYGDGASDSNSPNGTIFVTFNGSIDQIIIEYGNHSAAPTNPGQQGISLHDITFCRPTTSIEVTKISTVVSDPVSGTSDPKAIPGAQVRYCISVSNAGDTPATLVTASDPLPAGLSYVPGSLTSGANCSGATQSEDDDDQGADETDPFGASFTSGTVFATANALAAGAEFSVTFLATVD